MHVVENVGHQVGHSGAECPAQWDAASVWVSPQGRAYPRVLQKLDVVAVAEKKRNSVDGIGSLSRSTSLT